MRHTATCVPFITIWGDRVGAKLGFPPSCSRTGRALLGSVSTYGGGTESSAEKICIMRELHNSLIKCL
jgi:hypothetical protein